MIEVTRRPNITLSSLVQAEIMSGLYTVSLTNLSRIATILKARCTHETPETQKFIERELTWLDKFESNLYLGVHTENNISITLGMDIDINNPTTALDSDNCSIDIFGNTFLEGTASPFVKQACYRSVLTGIINNFRFYQRYNCNIIVFDYRHIIDCITLYYCYRDMNVTIEQIESILDDCKPGIVNQCTSLDVLIKFCLATNRSVENVQLGLVKYKTNSVRDGELYRIMSQLRISPDCFQVIKGSNKIETWQHHRLDFLQKMQYKKVLDYSAKEVLPTITYSIANDIANTPAFNGIKIICADNSCVALSVPISLIDSEQLHKLGNTILRLFNRSFEIPCRIYKYNESQDILEEI